MPTSLYGVLMSVSLLVRRAAALSFSCLTLAAPGLAHATAAVWDTVAAGQSGSGASSASPWVSSSALNALVAEWNFMSYPADNTPDIAGAGALTETTGAAFATSGGNIYSFSLPTSFVATLGGAGTGLYDVYLRLATLGTSVATAATLEGVSANRVVTFSASASQGMEEESLWLWQGVSAGSDGTFTFRFNANSSSMSLDQVALYASPVASVPEPSTWSLMLVGVAASVLAMRRRRTQA